MIANARLEGSPGKGETDDPKAGVSGSKFMAMRFAIATDYSVVQLSIY
jgi:hypothetical protein